MAFEVRIYTQADGKSPYLTWLASLDGVAKARIGARIARLGDGNLGDCKAMANAGGVRELRLQFGPGYRIYFGKDGNTIVVLLCGGDKSTQRRDVAKAAGLWREYLAKKGE